MKGKVVVGMSGGVDSFVAALMLKREGYEVVGVNLELWGSSDLADVQKICQQLEIPLLIRRGEKLFREKVVDDFVEDYRVGKTPSPCCICNSYVKWELLNQVAEEIGASWLATGHYIRIVEMGGKRYLCKGVDPQKDQSYFLWGIPHHILAKALTPLGDLCKSEVKAWAIANGYEQIAKRRESMGVCFLRGSNYRDFIRMYGDFNELPGDILNQGGEVIGTHCGICNYTIGQKQGLPVVNGKSLYVVGLDVVRNIVMAGTKDDLWCDMIYLDRVQLVDSDDLNEEVTVKVRGIGLNPKGTAKVELLSDNCACVRLTEPAWAVAPGQPVVFFHGDRVLGGGFVCRNLEF